MATKRGNEKPKTETTAQKQDGSAGNPSSTQTQQEFTIEKVYIKDASFEAPFAAEMFRSKWEPEVQVDLQTSGNKLDDNVHEVILSITVSAKNNDKTAFIAEVKKAGIFVIRNYPEEQIKIILATVCPNILFPYAREVISDLIVRGGFPTIYLRPVNFEALYAESQARKAQGQQGQQGQSAKAKEGAAVTDGDA